MHSRNKQITLAALAVLLLGVAGLMAFRSFHTTTDLPEHFKIKGVCLACGKDVEARTSFEKPPPAVCPECGKEAVYRLMYCPACKKTFVPRLVQAPDGQWRAEPYPSCPGCGAAGTMAYEPGLLDEPPVGRITPLPKWPP